MSEELERAAELSHGDRCWWFGYHGIRSGKVISKTSDHYEVGYADKRFYVRHYNCFANADGLRKYLDVMIKNTNADIEAGRL